MSKILETTYGGQAGTTTASLAHTIPAKAGLAATNQRLSVSNQVTKQQVVAMFKITMAVSEAIRELGQVPSGHLYARLMDTLSPQGYESIINTLKGAGVVAEDASHLLRWVGPKVEVAK